MSLLKVIFSFCSIVLVFSCTPEMNKKNIGNNNTCSNIEILFKADPNIRVLDIFADTSLQSIRRKVERPYKNSNCYDSVHFAIPHRKYPIKVIHLNPLKSCYSCILSTAYSSKLRIKSNGEILFDDKSFPIKNLNNHVFDSFYPEKRYRTGISIDWIPPIPLDSISLVLDEIIDGYTQVYDSLSMKKFNKFICDANSTQIDSLKDFFPFKIYFRLGYFNAPLPLKLKN